MKRSQLLFDLYLILFKTIQVLIVGTFLKCQAVVAKCNWSCMFGEVEVPVEVLADGILCCQAPPHKIGRVPFYVTCYHKKKNKCSFIALRKL